MNDDLFILELYKRLGCLTEQVESYKKYLDWFNAQMKEREFIKECALSNNESFIKLIIAYFNDEMDSSNPAKLTIYWDKYHNIENALEKRNKQ